MNSHYIYKNFRQWLFVIIATLANISCVDVEEYSNTGRDNMEALWRIMDERYCFFEEKGVDWNEIHTRYAANISPEMSRTQLFEMLGKMIGELKDGHVNLSAPFDLARNWSWKENYPANYSDTLMRHYLGRDYRISSGIYYRILDDNIGYMYVGSFADAIGNGNLDEIMLYLSPCKALIVDVRNNGGGMLTEAEKLAARFINERVLVGYVRHKTGTGHSDFSSPQEQWLEPASGIRWQKSVYVLTNRSVYSAANEFVKYMKHAPLALVIGDNTGGGSGMPYSAELPNGWTVRFSACPMYDADGSCTEQGIAPDVAVSLSADDVLNNKDTIIEMARGMSNAPCK